MTKTVDTVHQECLAPVHLPRHFLVSNKMEKMGQTLAAGQIAGVTWAALSEKIQLVRFYPQLHENAWNLLWGSIATASKTLKSLQRLISWYLWVWVTEIVREEKLTGYQNCDAGLHPQCSSWFFPVGRLTGKESYSLITECSRKHCYVFLQFIIWNGIFMVKQTYTEFEKSNEFLTRNFPIFWLEYGPRLPKIPIQCPHY